MELFMKTQPLLSICIPTYKREYLIEKLIIGIYAQKCDNNLFEVCITDNSVTDETSDLISSKFSNIDNLHYKKVQCEGFRNSIEALKTGNGMLLKLHNDYSMFCEGSLQKLIDTVNKYEDRKPVLFYTLRGKKEVKTTHDFNEFMNIINYLSTWSTSFSIWKEDFDRLMNEGIECNYMYPHTSLLFAEYWKKIYIIDENKYFYNEQPKKKGGYNGKSGYNLIDNFVRIFLTMVNEDLIEKQLITGNTYSKIEKNILRFCAKSYVNLYKKEGITYTFDDKRNIISKICGKNGYALFCMFVLVYSIKKIKP